jgi:CRISPR type III-A-associated RAMP protein Csm4
MNRGLVIKLRPAGPWRIGPDSGARNRVDVIYHSDSLFSAVTSAMARMDMLSEWLDATARTATPAVCFSSCFPFLDEVSFVVPPRIMWPPTSPALMSARVRWKSARFIPLTMVPSLLSGEKLNVNQWSVDGASGCLVPNGRPGPFRTGVRWNAAVDRLTGASERHATACIEFRPGCGLWTVAGFADDAARDRWQDAVKAAFRLLADTGFGGERSRGWGRAETPEFIEGTLPGMILPEREPARPAVTTAAEMVEPAEPVVEEPFEEPTPAEEPPSEPLPDMEPPEEEPDEEPPAGEPPLQPPAPEPDPEPAGPAVEEPEPESSDAPRKAAVRAPSMLAAMRVDGRDSEDEDGPREERAGMPEAAHEAAPEEGGSTPTATPEAGEAEAEQAAQTSEIAESPEPNEIAVAGVPEMDVAGEETTLAAPEPPVAEVAAETAPAVEPVAEAIAEPEPERVIEPEPAAVAEAEPEPPSHELAALAAGRPAGPPLEAHWLLSLFTPAASDAVDWARGSYTVLARGGRIESPSGSGELKKQIQMVAEGSVLYADGVPVGAAADVAPDGFAHPVFRAGFALSIRLPEVH